MDVYSDATLLAEGVRLTGRNVTYGNDLITSSNDQVQYEKANFYIRLDGNIQGADARPAGSYYPQNSAGGSYIGELNEGTIQVSGNESLWKTLSSGTLYIFSSDGSATAAVITQIPDYTKFGVDIDTTKQKVIWYVVKKEHGRWHVDGVVVDKETTSVDVSGDGGSTGSMEDTKLPTLPGTQDTPDTPSTPSTPSTPDTLNTPNTPGTPDNVTDHVGTIYYKGGVMMYDGDGDGDYNDLVVDYDVEANFPANDAQSPYIRVVMHLRALSDTTLDKVSIEMTGMENYVCPNDDMYITFHGINIDKTPAFSENGAYTIPDPTST